MSVSSQQQVACSHGSKKGRTASIVQLILTGEDNKISIT